MPECRENSHHFIAHTFSQSNNLYKQAYPTKPLTPLYALTQYEQLDITLYKKVTYSAMKGKILYLRLLQYFTRKNGDVTTVSQTAKWVRTGDICLMCVCQHSAYHIVRDLVPSRRTSKPHNSGHFDLPVSGEACVQLNHNATKSKRLMLSC